MNLKVAISVKPLNFYDSILQDPDKFTKLKNLWHLIGESDKRLASTMSARLLLSDLLEKNGFIISLEDLALRPENAYQLPKINTQVKPAPGHRPHLSISHSKSAIAACISLEKNLYVGIDIEDENRLIPEGTEKYFIHENDFQSGVINNEDKLKIWTSKEAAFKAIYVLSKQVESKVQQPLSLNQFQLPGDGTFIYGEKIWGTLNIFNECSQIIVVAKVILQNNDMN